MSFYVSIKNIAGSVTTKNHEQWIQADSFEFDLSRRISVRPGQVSDREHTTPSIGDVILTKQLDKSSPYLFEAGCTGTSLGQIKIDACGGSGDSDKYLQYTLSDVIISKYEIMGNDDHETHQLPTETLRLNFTKLEMTFTPRNSDNKPLAPVSAGYDIEKATSL